MNNIPDGNQKIYQPEIYDAINQFDGDFEFFRKWCSLKPGPVLEICAGSGRLTIPLKKSGIDITGLDISEAMLAAARSRAAAENLDLQFLLGDMRNFDLERKFATIFIPFNSLQEVVTIDDVEATLTCVRKHLVQDGLLLFDVFNPSIHFMVDREREISEPFEFVTAAGKRFTIRETCSYKAATQVNRVRWHFCFDDGVESVQEFDMRCYYPLELKLWLKHCGFQILHKFGSFAEDAFREESSTQIFVCTPIAKQNPDDLQAS